MIVTGSTWDHFCPSLIGFSGDPAVTRDRFLAALTLVGYVTANSHIYSVEIHSQQLQLGNSIRRKEERIFPPSQIRQMGRVDLVEDLANLAE